MTAKIKYEEPQVERKLNEKVEGVLVRIVSYESTSSSQSVPGYSGDKNNTTTTINIRLNHSPNEEFQQVTFPGFVGFELIGQEVQYDDRTTEKTTYFDPTGRKNDPSFRNGKKETERIHRLLPKDRNFPIYTSTQRDLTTL